MFSLTAILIGVGVIAAGVLIVKFTFKFMNLTGRQDWIERYAGSGSTYGVYKLFGVALVILGFLIATGFGNDVIAFFLSPFKSVFHPLN